MASSQFLSYKNNLQFGKHLNWRFANYLNQYKSQYDKNDLENLMDISGSFGHQDKCLEYIKESLINGKLNTENIYFLIIDSSYICHKNNFDKMLKKEINIIKSKNKNAYFILINSLIDEIENNYKLTNIKKYNNVNIQNIKTYKSILKKIDYDGDIIMDYKYEYIDYIYTPNFENWHKIITTIENDYEKKFGWTNGSRNEVNDLMQIQIIENLINILPGSNGMIFSNDRNLINQTNENIYIITDIKNT